MLPTSSLTDRSYDNRLPRLCDLKVTICYRAQKPQIDKTFVYLTAIDTGSVGTHLSMGFFMSVSPTVYTVTSAGVELYTRNLATLPIRCDGRALMHDA